MTSTRPTPRELTVPAALMTLLHTADGRPYQRFGPAKCTAFAELAELSVSKVLDIDGDLILGARVAVNDRGWVSALADSLGRATEARPVQIRHWLRRRSRAYAEHRDRAIADGVLERGRSRVLGVPYRTTRVTPEVRYRVIADLVNPVCDDPRIDALAAIVVGADIVSVLDLTAEEREQVAVKASAADRLGAVGLSAPMAAALATVGYLSLTGS
ncbi:GPP34 family phosphoprotein [Rhodococcus sp. BP-241]|uniref:GPP34 family phosphoprotein n=1 Tax=Rhodococcus sp. BP-241 TaxID=2739441 RepID=UPI001C9B5419|nr:GPP34 family phosphoprotein [Rhodococcus sp. BP-241]MBY6709357.1 GPP34 family phosphoprotein [Rhodococcus sp. BP-241]